MNFPVQNIKSRAYDLAIIAVLLVSLLGVIVSHADYGASLDEPLLYQYADILPSAYIKAAYDLPALGLEDFGDLQYYGSSYMLLGDVAARFLSIFKSLDVFDRWHIINFASFLLGTAALYWLCKKFSSPIAALITSLLYLTQPLLWGHAIMNPKDTPFSAFFIITVALGIKAVDSLHSASNKRATLNNWATIARHWYSYVISAITLISLMDRIFDHLITSPIITKTVTFINSLPSDNRLRVFVESQAPNLNSTNLDLYVQKLLLKISLAESVFLGLVLLLVLILFLVYSSPIKRWIFLAGISLGITASIRILGPFAGVLVLIYWGFRQHLKVPARAVALYLITASLTAYALWPYLWSNPFGHIAESFSIMANFPWTGSVRFEGIDYPAGQLPWYYLPKLIGLQLTIPALLLFMFGTFVIIRRLLKKTDFHLEYWLPILWFFVPIALWMILRPTTYDNFRQFLFLIPALFVMVSIGLDTIIKSAFSARPRLALAFCALLLLPGMLGGIILHPYEYVYYNGLAGWTQNIGSTYEADYLWTSFCEAGKYLNPSLTGVTQVAVTDPVQSTLFKRCITHDPQILVERLEKSMITPDFSVISTRWGDDKDYFRSMTPVHAIHIGKTELLVIKAAEK